jgi:hypothetical protein
MMTFIQLSVLVVAAVNTAICLVALLVVMWEQRKLSQRISRINERVDRNWRDYMSEADEDAQITNGSIC